MRYVYPEPRDVGIKIPGHVKEERFCAGFKHALMGGQLDHVEYFRLSFREGYRAAKLYLRFRRRQMGLLQFPVQGRFKIKVH
jgi:hypothetical protein